jgi:DNA-binding SARP family transcriptional activator
MAARSISIPRSWSWTWPGWNSRPPPSTGEIVGGELLEGLSVREDPFEEWLADQRARIKALACDRLGAAARSRADAGAIDEAIETARRHLGLDPANEAAHRLLMTL